MPLSNEELEYFKSNYGPTSTLGLAVDQAARKDPARFAQDIKLARDSLLPVDVVERNRDEIERRQRVRDLNLQDIETTHPATAKYLSDAENAGVSLDDVPNLKALEESTKKPVHGFVSNLIRGGGERVDTLVGNLIELAGNLGEDFDSFTHSLGLPNPGIKIGPDGVSWSWDIPEGTPNTLKEYGARLSKGGRLGYQPRFTWENFKGETTAANLAGYVIEQGVQSLPDMAAALYTLPLYVASRTEEIAEDRVSNDERTDVTKADLATSLPVAVAVSLLEKIGAKITFGVGGVSTVKGVAKATAGAALVEGATEFVQEGVEYLGSTAGTKHEVSVAEMLDRQVAGLVAGAGMGGAMRGATASTEALLKKANRTVNNRAVSVADQSQIESLITYTQLSNTRQISPEHFSKFLDTLDIDQSIYVDKDMLPEGAELPDVITRQLDDPSTQDVVLTVRDFVEHVAGDEALVDGLRPHLRLSPNAYSLEELANDVVEQNKALIERATADAATVSEAQQIYENVIDQLIETDRMSAGDARLSAAIIPAYFATKAKSLGVSALDLFESVGLKIRGPEAPSDLATSTTVPPIPLQQDFKGVTFEETATIQETGKRVKLKQDPQKIWDQTTKRRAVVEDLIRCLGS